MWLLLAVLCSFAAGTLIDATSARSTIAVFVAFGLVLIMWAPSASIRIGPGLDEVDQFQEVEPRPYERYGSTSRPPRCRGYISSQGPSAYVLNP